MKAVIDDDGEMVTTKEEVSKKVAAYFEQVYQADRMTDVTSTVDDLWGADRLALFSFPEVEEAMRECNFNKGLGPDGFDGTLL